MNFEVAKQYIFTWIYILKNLKNIINKRDFIQKNRIVNDIDIFKKMTLKFGKLDALLKVGIPKFK